MACYPALNLSNPKPYITQLCELLTGYPIWAGEAAIKWASDNCKFPPTRAELHSLLEDQVRYTRRTAELAAERAKPALEPPREVRPSYAELQAKYGEKWGIGPPAETAVEVNARWSAQVPSWDAIIGTLKSDPAKLDRLADLLPTMRGEGE